MISISATPGTKIEPEPYDEPTTFLECVLALRSWLDDDRIREMIGDDGEIDELIDRMHAIHNHTSITHWGKDDIGVSIRGTLYHCKPEDSLTTHGQPGATDPGTTPPQEH